MTSWTKTVSPSDLHRQQKEAKKKMLDKLKNKLYNTLGSREGSNPSTFSFDNPPLDFSIAKKVSATVFLLIKHYLDVATEACAKEGYSRPIISGGAIRDAMYGVYPKDYDIFVDISGVEDDELTPDDRFHLLVDTMFPSEKGWSHNREDKEAYRQMNNHFLVFTCTHEVGGVPIQVIGRYDPLIRENPLDFTNDFPYNLIKNVAFDDKIVVSAEAIRGFETKTIQCADGGFRKGSEWKGRRYYSMKKEPWTILRSPAEQKDRDKRTKNRVALTNPCSEQSLRSATAVRTLDYDDWLRRWQNPNPIPEGFLGEPDPAIDGWAEAGLFRQHPGNRIRDPF